MPRYTPLYFLAFLARCSQNSSTHLLAHLPRIPMKPRFSAHSPSSEGSWPSLPGGLAVICRVGGCGKLNIAVYSVNTVCLTSL